MGSDESHFNVSVWCDGQSHKTVSTNHNPFKRKESRRGIEPRSFRLPALPLGQTDSRSRPQHRSPSYNRTGWLGVKHQLTYLLHHRSPQVFTHVTAVSYPTAHFSPFNCCFSVAGEASIAMFWPTPFSQQKTIKCRGETLIFEYVVSQHEFRPNTKV